MNENESTQSKTTQTRGSKDHQERIPLQEKQLGGTGKASRISQHDGQRLARSSRRWRNPFGPVNGGVVNQLIESTQLELDELRESILRQTEKSKKIVKRLKELKDLRYFINEEKEKNEHNNLISEEE